MDAVGGAGQESGLLSGDDHARLRVREAFQRLPAEQREALHLVTIEGLAYQEAADVLGRHHCVVGEVVKGFQRGRELGFPTANLARDADGVVIAVNAQQGDGEDVSWLWDVAFEDFGDTHVVAAGERATDLAVRLTYANIGHERVHDPIDAIRACPPGRVEVLANYTALLNLRRALTKEEDYRA